MCTYTCFCVAFSVRLVEYELIPLKCSGTLALPHVDGDRVTLCNASASSVTNQPFAKHLSSMAFVTGTSRRCTCMHSVEIQIEVGILNTYRCQVIA